MIDSLIAFTFVIAFTFGTIYLITHFGGKRK